MIRYLCPNCGRRCESADVLRGFPVICLGCRSSIRVPDESTLPDELPVPTETPSRVSPPTVSPTQTGPRISSNNDVAATPVSTSASAISPPTPRPKPPIRPATDRTHPPIRRLFVPIAVTAAVLLLLLGTGFILLRPRRPATSDDAPTETMARIRDNFTAQTLARLAAKHPTWRRDLAEKPLLSGKWVVLSVVGLPEPTTFWDWLLASWPGSSRSLESLVDDLWRRGQVDDLMLESNPGRWAQGIGETDVVVGIHWWREVIGLYRDGERIALPPGWDQPLEQQPLALRWRAVGYVLDRTQSTVVAVRNFVGKPPAKPPASNAKQAVGPRPEAEVRDWLKQLESAFEPSAQP